MFVLGLGSNVGDRLENLRKALRLIRKIPKTIVEQVSPIYISDALLPENAPAAWDMPYLNLALRCETKLSPYELLSFTKKIEVELESLHEKVWGPRSIDIDILAWDDLVQYDKLLHIPHEHLLQRPFALWPLADVAPDWVYPLAGEHQGERAATIALKWPNKWDKSAPLHTRQIQQRIDTAQIVATINLTPDSFSEDGQYNQVDHALAQVKKAIEDGAEVIDIGAEATNPLATPISDDEEWRRLEPFLSRLFSVSKHEVITPKVSIDTRYATTAKKALALGVDWINDVSGLQQHAMQEVIASHICEVVMMHHVTIPARPEHVLPSNEDVVNTIYQWGEKQLALLEKNGIAKERIIFDVGLGFGKTASQSFALVKNMKLFQSLGVRLLVGHSRKLFLKQFTAQPVKERDIETLLVSLHLNQLGIDYLRVHQVDFHARAFKLAAALNTSATVLNEPNTII